MGEGKAVNGNLACLAPQLTQILLGYISQPQVWNKYVYVLNNPLKHTDPDGRRELTEEDQKRLQILWDEYHKAKGSTDRQINSELVAAIIGAI